MRTQQQLDEPLQLMYQLVQKHHLNPTIAVLQTSSDHGRTQVQVQVDLDISVLEGKPAGKSPIHFQPTKSLISVGVKNLSFLFLVCSLGSDHFV